MELPRYRISRQRVCRQCSIAKAKCSPGFQGAACGRCNKRRLACSFRSSNGDALPLNNGVRIRDGKDKNNGLEYDTTLQQNAVPLASASREGDTSSPRDVLPSPSTQRTLDFNTLDLFCPIDAEGISNRWLNPYIPAPGQKPKAYDPTVTSLIHRSLKSYIAIIVHGRGIAPFIHPQQLSAVPESQPLRTCLNVVRLLDRPSQDDTAIKLFRKEMEQIVECRHECGTAAGLSAFQAYLTYSLALYFWTAETAGSILVQSMIHLQDLAGTAARQGIVCSAEHQHTRPEWEAWIVAEAKRRTMYIMYLFDGLLSAKDGLPSFLGTELVGLHAPGCQSLWSSESREDWQLKYNTFLAQWPDGYLTIDELWPNPHCLDEKAVARRRDRVDHWLEDVDKFGTMMYAVTTYIHKT